MMPWNEGRSPEAIRARCTSRRSHTRGQKSAQPHEGHLARLGAGHYVDSDRGPLALPGSSGTVHSGRLRTRSMSILSDSHLVQTSTLTAAAPPPDGAARDSVAPRSGGLGKALDAVRHGRGLLREPAVEIQPLSRERSEQLSAETQQF